MGKRGTGAPHTLILNLTGSALAAAPGTDFARIYVPARPQSEGWIIRGVRVKAGAETGTATGAIDVQNQTTSILSSTMGITGTAAATGTLVTTQWVNVAPGRFLSIDATAGAGTWSASTGFTDVILQIDYDRMGERRSQ